MNRFFRARNTSYWHAIAEWAMVALLAGVLILLASLSGCAETKADFYQRKFFRDPQTGKVLFDWETSSGAFARAPSNASAPTTQSVGEDGVVTSVSPVHTKTADQIVAENGKFFYYAAAGFAVLAVVGFTVLKSPALGAGFGVAGGACALTPVFLDQVGPWLLPIGGLALTVGGIWYVAKRHASNQSSKLAAVRLTEADQLGQQGKYVEALDTMRSGIDVLAVNKPVFAKELKS